MQFAVVAQASCLHSLEQARCLHHIVMDVMNHDDAEILPAPSGQSAEALELVFAQLAQPDRREQVETLLARPLDPEGLLLARRGGRLVGAVCAQVQLGRTALAWPPRLAEGEPPRTADRLLDHLHARCRRAGVAMVNVLLERVSPEDDAVLSAAGYQYLTELLYLASGEHVFPRGEPASPLEFEPYGPANHARLAAVVKATYDQTRDCPDLDDPRSMDDVLLGYRHTGAFDPSWWRIVRHRGRDVGCLLVCDHAEHGSCELVYMGLTAPSRGHGWGKEIARYAQWLTAKLGRPRLVLAVDARNEPALALYAVVGFHAWDRRNVYVKRFESPTADCPEAFA